MGHILIFVICRYDSSIGVFTVSSGHAGLYYFYVHVLVDEGEFARFGLKRNDEKLCGLVGDNNNTGAGDFATGTCATTVMLNEGNKIVG